MDAIRVDAGRADRVLGGRGEFDVCGAGFGGVRAVAARPEIHVDAVGVGGAGDAAAVRPPAIRDVYWPQHAGEKDIQDPSAQSSAFRAGERGGGVLHRGAAGRTEFRTAIWIAGGALPAVGGGNGGAVGAAAAVVAILAAAGERPDA